MNKLVALILCLVMCIGLLVACGDSVTPDSTGSSNTAGSTGDGTGNDNNTVTPSGEKKYDYDMSQYIILPNYKDYEAKISLDQMQRVIDNYIMEYAVKSKRQSCMLGDVVNVSYTGYHIDENGEILYEDGKPVIFNEGESFGVYLGSHMAVEDFENGIVGMKIDDIKDIYVTMPSDYFEESLAGKRVVFEVILNAIYEAPIYNNSFVSAYFPEYTNTYDFEEYLKTELVLDVVYEYIQNNAVILSYPEKEYNKMAEELKKSEEGFLAQNGITIDAYLELQYGMTREQYIKQQMKREMIFYAIAQAENVEITSQMLTNERASLISYYKEYYKSYGLSDSQALSSAKALVDDLGEGYIYENVLFEQVDGLVPHLVKTVEKPLTYESITKILAERQTLIEGGEVGNICPSYDMEIFDGNGATGLTVDPSKNIGKITIINFWGTWCGPCKSELPDFDRIATEYKDVLTIYAVHSTQDYKKASSYVETNFPNTEMIFLKDYLTDPNDQYSGDVYFEALGGTSYYPYTVILDENGIVVYNHVGMMSYEELEAEVEKLLQKVDDSNSTEQDKDVEDEEDIPPMGGGEGELPVDPIE